MFKWQHPELFLGWGLAVQLQGLERPLAGKSLRIFAR
jgi:hypothetical protein